MPRPDPICRACPAGAEQPAVVRYALARPRESAETALANRPVFLCRLHWSADVDTLAAIAGDGRALVVDLDFTLHTHAPDPETVRLPPVPSSWRATLLGGDR